MPAVPIRCFSLSFAQVPRTIVWILGQGTPALLTPQFSRTFSRPKILRFYAPPSLSHFSASPNLRARRACRRLRLPVLFGGQTSSLGFEPLRSSILLTLVREEAPQFGEDQPHHEHLGGPRGPSAAGAAAPGAPTAARAVGSQGEAD